MKIKLQFCQLEVGDRFIAHGILFIKVPVFFSNGGPYNCISIKAAANNYATFVADKEEIEKL